MDSFVTMQQLLHEEWIPIKVLVEITTFEQCFLILMHGLKLESQTPLLSELVSKQMDDFYQLTSLKTCMQMELLIRLEQLATMKSIGQ